MNKNDIFCGHSLRDILDTLIGSDNNENYPKKFRQNLSFSLYYRFVKRTQGII